MHYYCCDNLGYLLLGVGAAGVLANTPLDQEFRNWYQDTFTWGALDDAAAAAKGLGDHWFTLPIYIGAAYAGYAFPDNEVCGVVGQWGNRTLRAFLVGAPSVGVLQVGLGASRPVDYCGSRWRPFRDHNAVAGHGFMGTVPFLTAASMTENRLCRCGLVAASFATQWARIHGDAHYLSQTVLGWWIAYLAVKSVNATEQERRALQLAPGPVGDAPGVNVLLQY